MLQRCEKLEFENLRLFCAVLQCCVLCEYWPHKSSDLKGLPSAEKSNKPQSTPPHPLFTRGVLAVSERLVCCSFGNFSDVLVLVIVNVSELKKQKSPINSRRA